MGVNRVTQEKIFERNKLLFQVRHLVPKEQFHEDPESFALWLDLLRIFSYKTQQPEPLSAPLLSVYRHFNRKFEVDYIESQWDLIERIQAGE